MACPIAARISGVSSSRPATVGLDDTRGSVGNARCNRAYDRVLVGVRHEPGARASMGMSSRTSRVNSRRNLMHRRSWPVWIKRASGLRNWLAWDARELPFPHPPPGATSVPVSGVVSPIAVSHPPEISGTKQLARLGSGWLVVHHGVLAAYRKARGQEFRFVPRPVVPWRADAAID